MPIMTFNTRQGRYEIHSQGVLLVHTRNYILALTMMKEEQ